MNIKNSIYGILIGFCVGQCLGNLLFIKPAVEENIRLIDGIVHTDSLQNEINLLQDKRMDQIIKLLRNKNN